MKRWNLMIAVVLLAAALAYVSVTAQQRSRPTKTVPVREHALKTITLNTGAYGVGGIDRRSESIVAPEDMHIVAISHFTGVQTGGFPTDNGHVLSLLEENPWEKWKDAATGMEPTGTQGYFGYCGRDYYSECTGISDIMWQEQMPAGCHVFVPAGATLYMHTYTGNGSGRGLMFHHLARVYYW